MSDEALFNWENLRRFVNSEPPLFGTKGVRDPDNVCREYDGNRYDVATLNALSASPGEGKGSG